MVMDKIKNYNNTYMLAIYVTYICGQWLPYTETTLSKFSINDIVLLYHQIQKNIHITGHHHVKTAATYTYIFPTSAIEIGDNTI